MSRRTSLATPDELRSALDFHSDDHSNQKMPLNDTNSRLNVETNLSSLSFVHAMCVK